MANEAIAFRIVKNNVAISKRGDQGVAGRLATGVVELWSVEVATNVEAVCGL